MEKKNVNQLTAIELIAKERQEQIEKHGYTRKHDKDYNQGTRALKLAATYALTGRDGDYPYNWDGTFASRISLKSEKETIIVAAALLTAYLEELLSQEIQSNLPKVV